MVQRRACDIIPTNKNESPQTFAGLIGKKLMHRKEVRGGEGERERERKGMRETERDRQSQ